MTPAILMAKKKKVNFAIHEYIHDANNTAYGEEAANKLGIEAGRVFKTLIVSLDNKKLAVAVIPVSTKLSLKLMAKACACKKVSMAIKEDVERSTGYILGGVSPLGQKKRLITMIDKSATHFESIYVSAGKRGLEIELSAADLASLTQAKLVDICQH